MSRSRQFHRRRRLAGGTRPAHPHHPQFVARVQARHHLLRRLVQRRFVGRERRANHVLDAAAADGFVQARHRVHAVAAVPFEDLRHPLARKTVAGKLFLGDRAFPQPVPAPAVTFVGVGGFLKTVTAQRVQHLVLNRFNRRRKIGNEMVRIGIEADDGRVRQKRRDVLVRTVRREDFVIHARQKILLEAADGFRRARHGLDDAAGIEPHKRAVAFLDFDDSVLDWHSAR